ncbi:MAG: glutathione S-transferase family protein [Rhodospirillaceae bacterium]|nr:glutathione S-transferase family protein [Rhodospirillaceae bacterium]MYH37707.1 glutathione S-transferase family protein [Rhodospirillaceae bacterium]MYK15769.1 glutathione S-transferase family protein [Rhodospirillaceae bacterium]
MSEPVTFYTNPMSRGQIVRWALEESGAAYETVIVEYGAEMKAPDYLAINPMGKVPAIRHGSRVVTECAAICAWLAEAFPEAGLAPQPDERAAYYRWMFFAAGPLEQAITAQAMGWTTEEDRSAMLGFGSFDDTIDAVEAMLRDNDYVCGSRFTMADVYVGSHIEWGLNFGTLPKRPVFEAYAGRIAGRGAHKRARAIDAALIAEREAAGS